MNEIPETEEDFLNKLIAQYKKETRIAKKVFWYSLFFLVGVMIYFSYNKPITQNLFLIFLVTFSVPAALVCTSAQAFCLSKSSLITWQIKLLSCLEKKSV